MICVLFSKMKENRWRCMVMNGGCSSSLRLLHILQGIWCQDDINQPSAWKIKQINVLKYENFISYWTDEQFKPHSRCTTHYAPLSLDRGLPHSKYAALHRSQVFLSELLLHKKIWVWKLVTKINNNLGFCSWCFKAYPHITQTWPTDMKAQYYIFVLVFEPRHLFVRLKCHNQHN